jgi:chitodextrinase
LATVAAMSGCSLENPTIPSLAGPSELGLSLTISATPDIITQDGQSQAFIEVIARDALSQPVRGLTLRAQTHVNGVPVDFGTLGSKTISTDNNGRASTVYHAPPAPPPTATSDNEVTIVVTPVGSNYANAISREVRVKLARPGIFLPPNGAPRPVFFFSPGSPKQFEDVVFDGSASTDADGRIVSYTWAFGDGTTETNAFPTTRHDYGLVGTYRATLTVTDDRGMSATSEPQDVNVGATAVPTANFSFSPAEPRTNSTVFFNGSSSVAAPGRTIVSYAWDFGDGGSGSGVTPTHSYDSPATYTVTLLVTDDVGAKHATAKTITICPPSGCATTP